MKLSIQYGDAVAVLPARVLEHMEKASKKDLRVLFALAAGYGTDAAALSAALSLSQADVTNAFAFWRGAGILSAQQEEKPKAEAAAPEAAAVVPCAGRSSNLHGLPEYTSVELGDLMERRKELSSLIEACEQAMGKIFNTAEITVIAGLTDYLGLDGEYILLLLSHCVRMGKKSMRYAEKTALALYDEGVTDAKALEERLRRIETMADITGKIRAMFGISSRTLTAKERGMLEEWICTMKYDLPILQKAYEVTVNSTGKASVPYANTVLERWYAAGYRTEEDIDRALAEYKRKKKGNGSSFDADDFFEAALKRTYGEN